MKKIRLIYLFLFTLAGCTFGNKAELESYIGIGVTKEAFDEYLESRMKELDIPGLAIAIINEGKVVDHKTLGYAKLEPLLPVTEKTIFEGASMSKSVFAFFVMKYVEEGLLDLDRPLYTYMPYPDIAYDERYKKITARMVLSHRTGFPNWRENEKDGKLRIKFEPGTGYEYSGEGYQYLAMVLRELEGGDWHTLEEAFQRKVGRPLGLEHTVFIKTASTRKNKAEPYDEKKQWVNKENDYWNKKNRDTFVAASSIHSEPLDFSKWMIAVMNKQLLSEESYAELFKFHSRLPNPDIELAYTLGFFHPTFPLIDTEMYGHGGDNDGFTCWFTLDVKKNWGFVLFTNSEYGQQLGEELLLYLMLGGFTNAYIIGGVVALLVLVGIGFLIRFVILRLKKKRK